MRLIFYTHKFNKVSHPLDRCDYRDEFVLTPAEMAAVLLSKAMFGGEPA